MTEHNETRHPESANPSPSNSPASHARNAARRSRLAASSAIGGDAWSNTGGARRALATVSKLARGERGPGDYSAAAWALATAADSITGIPAGEIMGKGRPDDVATVRQIVMYILREGVGATLEAVGAAMGGRNHGTVIHARKKITRLLEIERRTPERPTADLIRRLCRSAGVSEPPGL